MAETLSFLALPLQGRELKSILGHDMESDKAAAGCRARVQAGQQGTDAGLAYDKPSL